MNNKQFSQRLHDAGLSLWELGDFLGIHPHELRSAGKPGALLAQPVRVLVDLARRLDLHPADLVEDLEPVLSTRRLTPTPAAAETEPDTGADALVLLTTLAMTSVPLDSDDLADILGWSIERVQAAAGHAEQHPDIGGPLGLRRIPPQTWTVTARLDILTPEQRTKLHDRAHYRAPLNVEEASVLLAAAFHSSTGLNYENWRQDHLDTEHTLKITGLIHSGTGPHRVNVGDDVRYSLDRRPQT